jgi:transcriptional regulator with XRE-family HTH domain
MGEQIKLARLRRKLSSELVAERAGISRQTLNSIERGASTVAIGS